MPEKEHKPGEEVPISGIYMVVHDKEHRIRHEVTCVKGNRFPPCNHCGQGVRFVLSKGAEHIATDASFTKRA